MSRKHHKRRRSLQANRELFRELDERDRAQYQLATATQEGMNRRVLEILDEISKENREGGAQSKP
jgi:hypothetical protein